MKRNPKRHSLPRDQLKRALVRAAEEALSRNGWKVERAPDVRATSVRRITATRSYKEMSHIVGIRTTTNGSLAFTRDKTDTLWIGLSEAKYIFVSCVDDFKFPRNAVIHLFDAARLKVLFSKEYAKRKKDGAKIKTATGIFIPLYQLTAITDAKYYGDNGILTRPEERISLSRYIQLQPRDVPTAVKKLTSTYRNLSEWEKALSRSLAEDVRIEIPDRKRRLAARCEDGSSDAVTLPGTDSKRVLDSLSSDELTKILFRAGVDCLLKKGWHVEKDPDAVGSNTRRITRYKEQRRETRLISIRTSKNGKLGYKLDGSGSGWNGLSGVDTVMVVCLDNLRKPRFADINIFSSDTVDENFSWVAKQQAKSGSPLKPGETLWLRLYETESSTNSRLLGGGLATIGMSQPFPDRPAYPERERHIVDLREYILMPSTELVPSEPRSSDLPTIREAKLGVALLYDVPVADIKIIIGNSKSKRGRRKPA